MSDTIKIKKMKEIANPLAPKAEQIEEVFYPVTHEKAVRDDAGNSLGSKLSGIEDTLTSGAVRADIAQNFTQAQKAQALSNIGITGIDTTVTSGSTNLITSGGVDQKFTDLLSEVVYDISAAHDGQTYADLTTALGANGSNLPESVRKGGVSVRFVRSSDNEYVQYRLMSDDWSVDTADWAIAEEGVYVDNPEFIYVKTDKDDKILWGIQKDGNVYFGAGVPQQVVNYINERIAELTLDEYEDIVTFLGNLVEGDTLATLLDKKVDKEEGKGIVTTQYVQDAENPEYIEVTTDSNDKVLEGITNKGRKEINIPVDTPAASIYYVDNPEWTDVKIDSEGHVLEGTKKNGTKYVAKLEGNGSYVELKEELDEQESRIDEIQDAIDSLEVPDNTIDIAVGKQRSYGSYQSELDASCIVPSSSEIAHNYNVGYVTVAKSPKNKDTYKNIVLWNHDDGSQWDLRSTRMIYNKYGFNGDFCCVFNGFVSYSDMKLKINNMKRLIADGNGVGLHAIFNSSYWMLNRNYDVKPDGGSNFAPTRTEMRGQNADGTGVNTFNKTITADTLASELWYMLTDATLIPQKNKKVVELTQDDVNVLNQQFVFYTDIYPMDGIEVLSIDPETAESATVVHKTRLQWLEYFYNGLIDNTLGFSSTANTLAARFAEDYSVPTGASVGDYYPDADHLINGKMVYWNDTTNVHFADAKVKTASGFSADDYQLVGKFTKGFYKDCFSTMNFEVMDRCIATAEAFFRKYFKGFEGFKEQHYHGVQYQQYRYKDSNNNVYLDRDLKMSDTEFSKVYLSRIGADCSIIDILSGFGIGMAGPGLMRRNVKREGCVGAYYGQEPIRSSAFAFNLLSDPMIDGYCFADYLSMFGVGDAGMEALSYENYMTFTNGIDNLLKFCYENAGNTVTRGGLSMKVYTYVKDILDRIVSSIGTGKVPVISVDTISSSPAIFMAIDILQRFCKVNGFDIVSYNEGKSKVLSMDRNADGNLFPNPGFEQMMLSYFGGDSTAAEAYLPDGWALESKGSSPSFSVTKEDGDIVMSAVDSVVFTRMYGLPAGSYKLSYTAKAESGDCSVIVRKVKNGDLIGVTAGNTIDTNVLTGAYADREVDIEIPAPHRNAIDESDFANVECDGYEDNVCYIEVRVVTTSGSAKIKNVEMYNINQ